MTVTAQLPASPIRRTTRRALHAILKDWLRWQPTHLAGEQPSRTIRQKILSARQTWAVFLTAIRTIRMSILQASQRLPERHYFMSSQLARITTLIDILSPAGRCGTIIGLRSRTL